MAVDGIKALEDMVACFPVRCPPVLTAVLPEPDSVAELRGVLAKVPMCKCATYLGPYSTAEDMRHLKFTEIPFPYDVSISLSDDYIATIRSCLQAVEDEHGRQARIIANWEVRDTYAERVAGISWRKEGGRKQFFDASMFWLE